MAASFGGSVFAAMGFRIELHQSSPPEHPSFLEGQQRTTRAPRDEVSGGASRARAGGGSFRAHDAFHRLRNGIDAPPARRLSLCSVFM